jgi:ParB family transcriptional regulator, chromosome partitioning protein
MIKDININELISDTNINLEDNQYKDFIESVRSKGILRPLVVAQRNDKYLILDGRVRYAIAKLLNLSIVSCVLIDISDREIKEINIIQSREHIFTSDKEYAEQLRRIMRRHNLSVEELAKKLDKSMEWVERHLNENPG